MKLLGHCSATAATKGAALINLINYLEAVSRVVRRRFTYIFSNKEKCNIVSGKEIKLSDLDLISSPTSKENVPSPMWTGLDGTQITGPEENTCPYLIIHVARINLWRGHDSNGLNLSIYLRCIAAHQQTPLADNKANERRRNSCYSIWPPLLLFYIGASTWPSIANSTVALNPSMNCPDQ